MYDVSIIICCFNSELRLNKTLSFIEVQKSIDLSKIEIIIVNNASTDKTLDLALQYSKLSCLNIKIINESTPGLMNARISGVKSASSPIIVFVDDDNWIDDDYLINVCEAFNSYPNVDIVGGQSRLPLGKNVGIFFPHLKSYAVGTQYDNSKVLDNELVLWGAGLSFRKSALEKILSYRFLCVGRSGSVQMAGDDTELCLLTLIKGSKAMYYSKLKLQHDIAQERFNVSKLTQMKNGFGASMPIIFEYQRHLEKRTLKNSIKRFILSNRYFFILWAHLNLLKSYALNDQYAISFWNGVISTLLDNEIYQKIKKLKKIDY